MMLDAHKMDDLEEYINNKKEKALYTWLGQYKESTGKIYNTISNWISKTFN